MKIKEISNVLLVVRDTESIERLKQFFLRRSITAHVCPCGDKALACAREISKKHSIELIIFEFVLGHKFDKEDLGHLREIYPKAAIIVMSKFFQAHKDAIRDMGIHRILQFNFMSFELDNLISSL